MQASPGMIRRGPSWRDIANRGDFIPGGRPAFHEGMFPFNASLGRPSHRLPHTEAVSSEVFFTILSCSGIAVVITEAILILILRKSKIAFPIKTLSINFLFSDLLFHVVTGGTSLAKFVLPRQSVVYLKVARQFLMGFTLAATFGAVTLMVLERAIAMTWPFYHKTNVRRLHIYISVATVWGINSIAYCASTLLYVLSCDQLLYALCTDGSGIQRFMNFMALRETTMLLILVSIYETVYVVACVILALQIASFMKRKRVQQERKRIQISTSSFTAGSTTSVSSAGKLSSPESTIESEVFEDENVNNAMPRQGVSATFVSCITINTSPEATSSFRHSSVSAETARPTGNNHFPAHTSESRLSMAVLISTAKVSMVVLSVALLQLAMHLPFLVKLWLMIFKQTDKHGTVGYQYLEVISLCLLQICTVPNVYLYVLRLKSCREQAKKLFKICTRE